jgi:hypothetical protein
MIYSKTFKYRIKELKYSQAIYSLMIFNQLVNY